MKTKLTNSAPGLVAVRVAAIAFAAASADTNPLWPLAQTPWDPMCSVITCPTTTRPTRRTLPGRAVLIVRGSNSGPPCWPT